MSSQARFLISGLLFVTLGSHASAANAQSTGPNSAAAELQQHYDSAQRYQQSGDLDRAAHEYRVFLSQALDQLAVGESHLGQSTKAAALFDKVVSLDPDSASGHLDYAEAELNAGLFSQAETLSRQALQTRAANTHDVARAHEILGRALLKLNRDQEARKELETAAAMEPSFDHSYNLAIACLDLDDAGCATRIFSQMQASYGDTPGIHMDFGRAWGQSDFQPRAEEEFRKVIQEDPKFPEAHYSLAATYLQENENDKIKAAQTELEKELTVSPNDFLTYAALGKMAASQQKDAEAARYLHRAIQLNPRNPDAYLYLGQMYFNASQWAQSEAALRKAILLTTDPSRNRYQIQKAHYLLGRILMRQGKEKEASAEMKIAQSFLQNNLTQDRSKLNGMLGSAGQGMGGSGAGVAISDSSREPSSTVNPEELRRFEAFRVQIAPPVADSYNNLGAISAVHKDYTAAASYFEQAATWNPSMEGVDLNWGRAAFSASEYGEAIKPLTHYLRTHPGEQNIRAVLGISQYMVQDYSGCVTTLQPVESRIKSVPQVEFVYADSLVKTGHRRAGVEMLTALEEKNPEIPDVHRALGEAYAHGTEKQKAIDELRKAVQLNPQDQRAAKDLDEAMSGQRAAESSAQPGEAESRTAPKPH